jgi:HemY protein
VHAARDPAWTSDGLVSDRWLPVSPATGRLDAFQWKVPVADLSPPGPVIEQTAPAPTPAPHLAPALSAAADEDAPGPASPAAPREEVTLPAVVRQRRPADGVIPLVHSPDDPGPEGELAAEPAPEGPSQPEGWWKRAFR